jgi:hypothetical protein
VPRPHHDRPRSASRIPRRLRLTARAGGSAGDGGSWVRPGSRHSGAAHRASRPHRAIELDSAIDHRRRRRLGGSVLKPSMKVDGPARGERLSSRPGACSHGGRGPRQWASFPRRRASVEWDPSRRPRSSRGSIAVAPGHGTLGPPPRPPTWPLSSPMRRSTGRAAKSEDRAATRSVCRRIRRPRRQGVRVGAGQPAQERARDRDGPSGRLPE